MHSSLKQVYVYMNCTAFIYQVPKEYRTNEVQYVVQYMDCTLYSFHMASPKGVYDQQSTIIPFFTAHGLYTVHCTACTWQASREYIINGVHIIQFCTVHGLCVFSARCAVSIGQLGPTECLFLQKTLRTSSRRYLQCSTVLYTSH